jgi:hypothetical protein
MFLDASGIFLADQRAFGGFNLWHAELFPQQQLALPVPACLSYGVWRVGKSQALCQGG